MTFKPTRDVAELTALVANAKVATLRFAEFVMQDLPIETRAHLVQAQDDGWRFAVEVSADVYGTAMTALTLIGPNGERKVVASIADGAGINAH